MPRTRTRPLILHVDDDEGARLGTARVLESAGFQVVLAETGAEGLSVAHARTPDLVVLDVDLPDLDGFEVCRRLRGDAALAGTPVLHLSGARLAPADKVSGLDGGADAYLVRPVEPDVLVATVRALLRVRRAEERSRRLLRRLQRTERAREDALSAAWNAVNEPLSAIEISGPGLRGAVANDVVARERLSAVLDAASRIRSAVQTLVELARAEARLPLSVGTYDARALLERSRGTLEAALAPAGAVLAVDLPAAGVALRCDARRLTDALVAALGAGVPALAAGQRVTLAAVAEADGLHLWISAPDAVSVPWHTEGLEPFWTARAEGRRGASALLSLARALVHAQGGRLWVEEDRRALHVTMPGATDAAAT
jgi:DNA-binding response OmpR family regulator